MKKSQAASLPLVLLLDEDPPLAAQENGKAQRKSSFSRLVPGWAQVAVMAMMIAQSGQWEPLKAPQSCSELVQQKTIQSAKTHALEEVTPTREKVRLGNFLEGVGRLRENPFSSLESATGYGRRMQEIASGRGEYCNGDPVNHFDPDGRFGKGGFDSAVGLVTGTAGLVYNGVGSVAYGATSLVDSVAGTSVSSVYADQWQGLKNTGSGLATLGGQVANGQFGTIGQELTGGADVSAAYRTGYAAVGIASIFAGGELADVGNLGKAGEAADAAVTAAKTAPQNVFWSGGRAAEDAARSFANANNGIIIGDTAAGRALAQATEGVPWSQARPQWLSMSEDFARSASGEVNVFQNSRGLSLDSIWRSEYKVLQQNPNVTGINYHVVMPDGSVIKLP